MQELGREFVEWSSCVRGVVKLGENDQKPASYCAQLYGFKLTCEPRKQSKQAYLTSRRSISPLRRQIFQLMTFEHERGTHQF